MTQQRTLWRWTVGWLSAGALAAAFPVAAQGIYVCTDARGKRITSDRPIPECNDRSQRELNPSGSVRRDVAPTYTVQERAQMEEREKEAAEARARAQEARRRDRALATRYPTPEAHDRERQQTLTQIDDVIRAANNRIGQLAQQRKSADAEMEFYTANPSRAPQWLKRQLADIDESNAIQKRFIADQEAEKQRVNARFDEERSRLKQLWVRPAG